MGGRDRVAPEDALDGRPHRPPRPLVRRGAGPHDQPHPARPLDALLLEPRGPHERELPGDLPARRGLGHLPRQDGLRPVAARSRAVRRPRLRARHGPRLVEEPPLPDLLLRLPVGERLPRRLRSRQARRRRARGRPRHDARQEVLDLGQRARRADVGPDPDRRGRPLHRAHDRRLLRQPARLLLDPAGRDAHRRPLLVPGARAGRRQGRQPRGRAQPRGEGRPGPHRRQHDHPPARRAGPSHRRRPGRLRASSRRSRPTRRSRGSWRCRPASARRTCASPSSSADGDELVAYENRRRPKAAEPSGTRRPRRPRR